MYCVNEIPNKKASNKDCTKMSTMKAIVFHKSNPSKKYEKSAQSLKKKKKPKPSSSQDQHRIEEFLIPTSGDNPRSFEHVLSEPELLDDDEQFCPEFMKSIVPGFTMATSNLNVEVKDFVALPVVLLMANGTKKKTIKIAQVLQVYDSSIGAPKLQVRLWEKFKEKNTLYHKSSNYSPNYIQMNESILLCNPSYKDTNDTSIVRFNKHIYEILYHVVKEKKLPYIPLKIEVLHD